MDLEDTVRVFLTTTKVHWADVLYCSLSKEMMTVLLGLRVYTKSDAKVNIGGPLRHGRLLSGKARK